MNWQKVLLSWCIIFSVVVFTLSRFSPPPSLDVNAAPTEFSAQRALLHLESIAEQPHAVGSQAHAKVRDYLIDELKKLGLTPQIQNASVATTFFGSVRGADVQNILARIPGRASTKAVALVAHYDSMPTSRGASDDGAGVVTLLETARALVSSKDLANDVILLFTDAEENGLLGARAFVAQHPWAHDIGIFFNFEARGNKGPSTMFRSSRYNEALIHEFAKVAPYPMTNSLVSMLAEYLPNDTDFTVLTQANLAGFDFAYAGGLDRYHSYEDSVERIDPRSIQHHGSYALSLTRHFGERDLHSLQSKDDVVYFDIFGWRVIYYSKTVAMLLGILNLVLFGIVFFKAKKIVRTSFIALLAVFGGATAVWALHTLIGTIVHPSLLISYSYLFVWPYLLIAILLNLLIYSVLGKNLLPRERFAGVLLPWVILSAITGIALPGASFLFQWPTLFCLIGYYLARRHDVHMAYVIALIPALILLTGLCYMIFVMEGGVAPYITAGAVGILFCFLMPLFDDISRRWRLRFTFGLLALVPAQILMASMMHFTENHPLPSSVSYALDSDAQQAFFITEQSTDTYWPRTEQSFTKFTSMPLFYSRKNTVYGTKAPLQPYEAPSLEVLVDKTHITQNARTLKLRVTSKRRADCIAVWEETPCTIQAISVDGIQAPSKVRFSKTIDTLVIDAVLGKPLRYWEVSYCNIPEQGLIIDIKRNASSTPMRIRVVDDAHEFNLPFPKRAINTIPTPWGDRSLVSKIFTL